MVRTYCLDEMGSPAIVASTVNMNVPVALGVPEMTPVDDERDRPDGSLPADTLKTALLISTAGARELATESSSEYGAPT